MYIATNNYALITQLTQPQSQSKPGQNSDILSNCSRC